MLSALCFIFMTPYVFRSNFSEIDLYLEMSVFQSLNLALNQNERTKKSPHCFQCGLYQHLT